jgi:DNA-binding response OmpR family regulator
MGRLAGKGIMRILIIDDDAAVRASIRILLKSKGHDVAEATDGDTGLRKAKEFVPALVLVDMFMPGKDGITTIREIRSHLPSIPVIAMSGSLSRDKTEAADELKTVIEIGARAMLHKPFRPNELLALVEKTLGN